jgi:hypothetical protein
MPASLGAQKDREIFIKILTMDEPNHRAIRFSTDRS